MSKISDAYDNMMTRIAAVLDPSYRSMPFAYAVERNPDIFLDMGYAVAIGEATNTKRFVSGMLSINRIFSVTLVQRAFALESDRTSRASTEKQLFEDLLLIIKDFRSDNTLNGTVISTDYVGDGGINLVSTEQEQFLYVSADFAVEYLES